MDPALDGCELIGSDSAYLLARRFWHLLQSEHRLNDCNVETEVPGMADEGQPPDVLCPVKASPTVGARRRGYESNSLIITDRLDIDARALGQGSDSDHPRPTL